VSSLPIAPDATPDETPAGTALLWAADRVVESARRIRREARPKYRLMMELTAIANRVRWARTYGGRLPARAR
jgi:hypothetical protein